MLLLVGRRNRFHFLSISTSSSASVGNLRPVYVNRLKYCVSWSQQRTTTRAIWIQLWLWSWWDHNCLLLHCKTFCWQLFRNKKCFLDLLNSSRFAKFMFFDSNENTSKAVAPRAYAFVCVPLHAYAMRVKQNMYTTVSLGLVMPWIR